MSCQNLDITVPLVPLPAKHGTHARAVEPVPFSFSGSRYQKKGPATGRAYSLYARQGAGPFDNEMPCRASSAHHKPRPHTQACNHGLILFTEMRCEARKGAGGRAYYLYVSPHAPLSNEADRSVKKKPGDDLLSHHEGSTIGVRELNFRVRNGNGCGLSTIITGHIYYAVYRGLPAGAAIQ